MGKRYPLGFFIVIALVATSAIAIPSSLVQEIKSSEESRNNKVKRSQLDTSPEENEEVGAYISKPTAIKRGAKLNLKDHTMDDQQSLNEWMQDQSILRNQFNMDNIQSGLYNPDIPLEDKSIAEYEKGFRYGTNKEKLDEALENAVLKSELYGEPGMINQYRYYGADDKRRKRRDAKMLRLKRDVELSPEEVLALLTLYENNRQQQESENNNYRKPWTRYGKQFDLEVDPDDFDRNDENWLDNPVYPHVGTANDINSNMFDYDVPQIYNKKSSWGGYSDNKKKRFMVSKKRTEDPTRMLRYLKGPNENDFNTLSKLLNNQRDPKLNVPVYRRFVL